jgi:subtilisin-like proprotein convertase family protein
MKFSSFGRLFGERWQRNASSRVRRGRARRPAPAKTPRLAVEVLEDRTLLSALPPPTTLGHSDVSGVGLTQSTPVTDSESAPQVAVDPLNPLNLVAVFQRSDPNLAPNPTFVVQGAASTDGGQSWRTFNMPLNPIDPSTVNPNQPGSGTRFGEASDPNVSFDRQGNFYVAYSAHSTLTFANGQLLLQKFTFGGGNPTLQLSRVIYSWNTQDPALAPTMAVDNNVPTSTDPDTGAILTDPFVGNVYVAWSTNSAPPTNAPANFNPNTIQMVVSSDGGQNFSTPSQIDDGLNSGADRNAYPRLVISQGTLPAGGTGSQRPTTPGQVTVVWDDFGSGAPSNVDLIKSDHITDGGGGFVFSGTGGAVRDAVDPGNGNPHIPQTTVFQISVPTVLPANFINVADMDVTVNLRHPALNELQIQLIPPSASGLAPITLVRNQTNADNTNNPAGVGFPTNTVNLGVLNGVDVGTVFDDQAARVVNDTTNFPPFVGHFRPDNGSLAVVNSLTPSQLSGPWTLSITDFRNGNVGFLDNWSLTFRSGLIGGPDHTVATTSVRGAVPTSAFPLVPAASPLRGIGPAPVIASDNTLGSFSPFQGRLYVAYVGRSTAPGNPADNTDIFLAASDDGGASWQNLGRVNDDNAATDGGSEANDGLSGRPQFQPAIAVDPATGTLGLSWYDARDDAARTRLATYVTTSIDGGQSFSKDVFANTPQQVFDPTTQQNEVVGPIADNPSANSDARFGFGDRQGLAFLKGHLYPTWTGNLNGGNFGRTVEDILTASMVSPAGPRIVSSTMGPVKAFTVNGVDYNNTFAPDGTQQVNAFLITFDRRVDVNTFDASDVSVRYRSVSTPGSDPGTPITVTAVTPVDTNVFGATQFVVSFPPQSGVGTYSYAIGPNISDLIRSVSTVVTPLGTNTFTAPPSQVNLRIPAVGNGGSGIPAFDTTTSNISVTGIPVSQVVTNAQVTVSISFPNVQNLRLTLIAPDGTHVRLVNENTTSGSNYINTVFDDAATSSITQGLSPYTAHFRPQAPLAQLINKNPNGTWQLEIVDTAPPDVGSLLAWSLQLQTGIVSTAVTSGNLMDQNANAIPGEDPAVTGIGPGDVYAVPRPTGSAPSTGGFFAPPYDPTSLPLIVPGPHIVNTHVTQNPVTSDNLVLSAIQASAADVPITVVPGGKGVSTINITDNYTILSAVITLDMDINGTSDIDAVLIAPDGTRITLFSGVGSKTQNNFKNTTLDDNVTVPISSGTAPFTSRFLPQAPLSVLKGRIVTGQYQLEITNHSATNGARLNSWSITFRKNSTVNSIDVTFDRDMDPTTVTPGSIVRLVGPAGVINGPFTVTPDPDNVDTDPTFKRTYRIGFPGQTLSGTYNLVLAPTIKSRNGDPLDTNQNAGLDFLRGTSPTAGTVNFTASSTNVPVIIPDRQTVNSTLNVTSSFLIQNVTLTLNITHGHDPDLTAVLVGPDGTKVTLFSGVGQTGTGQNFLGTVFDDTAATQIQNGGPPFSGRFTPQIPLGLFTGKQAKGTWTLQITDSVANGQTGRLNSWFLNFGQPVPLSGLGEPVTDEATVSFRIFATDPTNPVSFQQWTPVGPAPVDSGAGSGSVTAIAVDPSDPSGNTVFIGAAAGGIWKTTNFLTTDPHGPTYVPLTDMGPNFAMRIGSISIFPRNNDPNQSIIFATTGDGTQDNRGFGFLRSADGGLTWTVLDSTTNVDAAGNQLPLNSPQRDHEFSLQGAYSSFKLVIDPRPTPSGTVILYAALATSTSAPRSLRPGLWRSDDNGDHWQLMRAGFATDVVLDPNSGAFDAVSNPTGNLQRVFASFLGEGVFQSPNRGVVWNPMNGGIGKPLVQDADTSPPSQIAVAPPSDTPNGAKGRIVLAKPQLTGQPAQDLQYEGWLWAVTVNLNGTLNGVYLTKDFGDNWTRVRIPVIPGTTTPSNNPNDPDYGITAAGSGNSNISITLDPSNPNIAYIGGLGTGASSLIRVDATFVHDPHAFFLDSTGPTASLLTQSGSPLVLKNGANPPTPTPVTPTALSPVTSPTINLIRHPSNPFLSGATFYVTNVSSWTNDGTGARWVPFDQAAVTDPFAPPSLSNPGSSGFHQIVSLTDPLTGKARLIFGNDDGVFTGLDQGNGSLLASVGDTSDLSATTGDVPLVNGNRNGNLQITQFFYGASQPSSLASQISTLQGMFYGESLNLGSLASDPNALVNGNLNWTPTAIAPPLRPQSARGSGTGVATDQTGTGTVYQYQWPGAGGNITDFFRVNGVGRTFLLIQGNNNPPPPDPQWPLNTGFNFGVNPLNGSQMVIGSAAGRVFGTTNQGLVWSPIGDPAALDTTVVRSFAYGAPQPNDPIGAINNFIYAGTTGFFGQDSSAGLNGGHVFVTKTGGGAQGNQWTNISSGLDGSPVEAIVTNPNRGSSEAYAVTSGGNTSVFPDLPVPNISISVPKGSTVTNSISINKDYFIRRLQVQVNITAQDDSALQISLIAPDGTVIPLLAGGTSGANLTNTTWADNFPGIGTGAAPYTGTFIPAAGNALTLLNGKNLRGNWTIRVTNGSQSDDTLVNWSLVVTSAGGVWHLADGSSIWAPVASTAGFTSSQGDLFQVPRPVFGAVGFPQNEAQSLRALAVDWRYTTPIIYAGGDGGVFRTLDNGLTWSRFPSTAVEGSQQDGGNLPNAAVTDLDLALGNVNPTTGRPDSANGLSTLLATTNGRGTFAIRVPPIVYPTSLALDPKLPAPNGSATGPGNTTKVVTPVIDGLSMQSAFGNVVRIDLLDLDIPNAPIIGVGTTDGSGHFAVQVAPGIYDPNGTTDGAHKIGVRATDEAGTIGPVEEFDFTLDTTPIVIAGSLQLDPSQPGANPVTFPVRPGSDSGLSATDRITNVTQPVFDGQISQAAPVTVQLFDVTNANSPIMLGQTTTNANGFFQITTAAGIYKPDGSTDGVKSIRVHTFNATKSSDTTFPNFFTLDTIKPLPPSLDLSTLSDTGPSNTDHITTITTPTFVGKTEPNALVQIFAQATVAGGPVQVGQGTADSSGNYSVTVSPLAGGFTYLITAQAVDVAGNVGNPTSPLSPPLVIITVPPSPPTLILDPASDTGVPGDNITAAIPQVYDGTNSAGVKITVKDGSNQIGPFDSTKIGVPQQVKVNGVVIATYLQQTATTFQLTWSLQQGVHTITVMATDGAGNMATSAPLTITVDLDQLDPDRKFIRMLYQLALGRTGSLAEWNLWEPLLQQPDGRHIVASSIERSPEARTFLVKGWYQTYLGRPAVNGEEQLWVNALLAGATEEQTLGAILGSQEYFNHVPSIPGITGGATDGNFVQALYLQLLGRPASAADINFWVNAIRQNGGVRSVVSTAILQSTEYRERVVRGYYQELLQRPAGSPSQAEVDLWAFSGLDITSIRVSFESSQEFFNVVSGFHQ